MADINEETPLILSEYQSSNAPPPPKKFWAYLSMGGKIPGFVGDAYWIGILVDLYFNLDEDTLELSYPALIIGCLLSLFSTASAMYCEFKINMNSNYAENGSRSILPVKLSAVQKAALAGYGLDQIGDKASSIGLVIHLIGGDLWHPRTLKEAQAAAIVFAFFTSIAEILTAKVHLAKTGEEVQDSNCFKLWSYLSVAGKLPGFVGDAYWLGIFIDLAFNLDEDVIGLSYPALIVGCILSFFSTLSAMYCEFKINVSSQSSATAAEVKRLSCTQKGALAGYALDQTGDKASAVGLVAHIIGGDTWSRPALVATQTGAMALGLITSTAEVVTARTHLLRIS